MTSPDGIEHGSSILGYPRIGAHRELKAALEGYWHGSLSRDELLATGRELADGVWNELAATGLEQVPGKYVLVLRPRVGQRGVVRRDLAAVHRPRRRAGTDRPVLRDGARQTRASRRWVGQITSTRTASTASLRSPRTRCSR